MMFILWLITLISGIWIIRRENNRQRKYFNKVIENLDEVIKDTNKKTMEEVYKMKDVYNNIAMMLGDGVQDD